MIKGKFIDNLPKIYGIYTGGFLAFIILMAIAEQMGMTAKTIGVCFVAFTVLIYALIGWLSRTIQVDAYYVAGRQVLRYSTVWRLQLTGCQVLRSLQWLVEFTLVVTLTWLSWSVGLGDTYLVSSLLAPYLRKFGCYTVPRFHWNKIRWIFS